MPVPEFPSVEGAAAAAALQAGWKAGMALLASPVLIPSSEPCPPSLAESSHLPQQILPQKASALPEAHPGQAPTLSKQVCESSCTTQNM